MDATGDSRFGRIVFEIIDLERRLRIIPDYDKTLRASDLEYLLAVQQARDAYSQDRDVRASEDAKRANKNNGSSQ